MPRLLATPCTYPGCPRASAGHGRCKEHARQAAEQRDQARGSASQRGYGAAWRKVRERVLAESPTCAVCGAPATDVDHITPRAQGGTDDLDNLRALCHTHHSQKTAKRDGRWGRQ